jgi:hypothetical protein
MTKKQLTPEEMMERNVRRQMQRHGAKIRERIKADTELHEEQKRQEAQKLIAQMEASANRGTVEHSDYDKAQWLCDSIKQITTVVARSFGQDQPIVHKYSNMIADRMLMAFTDLKVVTIGIKPSLVQFSSDEEVRRTTAVIKGATYHEFAHCMWTKHLIKDYFPIDDNAHKNFKAWNLLEDGRIEALLIVKSPIIKKYLLPMMWDIVVNVGDESTDEYDRVYRIARAVPFLLVRTYIPKGIQRQAVMNVWKVLDLSNRDTPATRQNVKNIISEMLSVSRGYNACTDMNDQIPFIVRFSELLNEWGQLFGRVFTNDSAGDPSGRTGESSSVESVESPSEWDESEWDNSTPAPSTSDGDSKPENSAKGESHKPSDMDMESDDDSDFSVKPSADDKDDKPSDSDDKENDGSKDDEQSQGKSSDHGDESNNNPHEELNKAVNEAVSDYELSAVMKHWGDTLRTGLPSYTQPLPTDSKVTDDGEMVRIGMINALDTVVMTASPSWKYRMETGAVLDVDAFTNREVGDDAYWMDKDDSGERGHDLAISILLDCSGSMMGTYSALGSCAYGIHSASQSLGIPCTTSIFGTHQYILWGEDETPTPVIMPDLGGTQVRECLESLPTQRAGKSRQIVFILTDGDWEYDIPTLLPYMDEDVHIVLIGLGMPLAKLTQKSPSRAITIKSVIDLPKMVEQVIGDFFR